MNNATLKKILAFVNADLSDTSNLMQVAAALTGAVVPSLNNSHNNSENIIKNIEKLLAEDAILLKEIQDQLQSILQEINKWGIERSDSIFGKTITASDFKVNVIVFAAPNKLLPLQVEFKFDNFKNAVMFNFYLKLKGINVDGIKTCPTCSKWFLQETRREKAYCSNSCAAKNGNRKRYLVKKK